MAFGGVGYARVQNECRVFGQVVEQGCRGLEEKGQVVLDALRRKAVADVLVNLAAAHVDIERAVPGVAETGYSGGVQRRLAARQDAHGVRLADRALAVDVENPQRVDLVVEEVDAHGVCGTHREHVDE